MGDNTVLEMMRQTKTHLTAKSKAGAVSPSGDIIEIQ